MSKLAGFSSPFGSQSRTRILMALQRDGESWGRKLSEELAIPVFAIQEALKRLELDGLVVSRLIGRTELLTLNPRYFAIKELTAYLVRLNEGASQAV